MTFGTSDLPPPKPPKHRECVEGGSNHGCRALRVVAPPGLPLWLQASHVRFSVLIPPPCGEVMPRIIGDGRPDRR